MGAAFPRDSWRLIRSDAANGIAFQALCPHANPSDLRAQKIAEQPCRFRGVVPFARLPMANIGPIKIILCPGTCRAGLCSQGAYWRIDEHIQNTTTAA